MIHIPILMIGTAELLVIAGAVLLLFGGKKIPELMHSLGNGVKEFKKGMNEGLDSEDKRNEENKHEPSSSQEKTDEQDK